MTTPAPTCTGPECDRPIGVAKRGLCKPHAKQLLARGSRDALTPLQAPRGGTAVTTPCTGPDCHKPATTHGLCDGHYQQTRRGLALTPIGSTYRGRAAVDMTARLASCHELLDAGVAPEDVATRLGTTIGALEMLCRRNGQRRRELANALARQRRATVTPKPIKPRRDPAMPETWHRKSTPIQLGEGPVNRIPSGIVDVDFRVPTLHPAVVARAARVIRRAGADDLAAMLGLDGSAA